VQESPHTFCQKVNARHHKITVSVSSIVNKYVCQFCTNRTTVSIRPKMHALRHLLLFFFWYSAV